MSSHNLPLDSPQKSLKIDRKDRTFDFIFCSILFLSVAVGIYYRFKGIGRWPLTADEYYIAKSVKNILAHGLPKFPFGGYYTRGLLYQYIVAPLVYFGSNDEFFLRIVPALSSLLAVPAIFWLSKRLSGRYSACIAVSIFCLSLWEIEFSRFARMYAPFQAVFIWYMVFLVKALIDKDRKSVRWLYFLSALSIFVYEGSIFLIALNFLPLILERKASRKFDLLICIALLIFAYLYESVDFTHMGAPPPLPAGLIGPASKGGIIYIPTLLFMSLPPRFVWIVSFAMLFLFNCFSSLKILRSDFYSFHLRLCLFFLIILSFFNLFALLAICATLFFLLHWLEWRELKKHIPWIFLFTVILNFIYWVGFCFATSEWKQVIVTTTSSTLGKLVFVLLNYPHTINNIVLPWARAIPILLAITVIFLGIGIFVLTRSSYERRAEAELLFTVLLLLILITGIFRLQYHLTRYTFFLYPVIVILFVGSSKGIWEFIIGNRRIALLLFLSATMALFFVSDDFELNHLINIDTKEINYRMNYNVWKTLHFYPRSDVKTPAEVINVNSKPHDIIITCVLPTDYYLKRLDYVYCDYIFGRCRNNSACEGTRDRWSGVNLVHNEAKLFELLDQSNKTVWIITGSKNPKGGNPNPGENRIFREYSKYLFYKSIDRKVYVYRIPPMKEASNEKG